MNFIEKIMSIGKPIENTATSADTAEPEAQSITANTTTNQPIDSVTTADAEAKTYTSSEISQLWEGKKLEWEEEMRNKSESYISSLPETERLKIQQLTKDEEIAGLKSQLVRRDLEKVVFEKLDESRLPASIAQFVQYSDEKGTLESLDIVIDVFNKAVTDGVMQRLRGKTPAGLGGAANQENRTVDPFARAFTNSFKR